MNAQTMNYGTKSLVRIMNSLKLNLQVSSHFSFLKSVVLKPNYGISYECTNNNKLKYNALTNMKILICAVALNWLICT
jgi:hypothetical protein